MQTENASTLSYALCHNRATNKTYPSVCSLPWSRWLLASALAMMALFSSLQAQTYNGNLLISNQADIDNFNYTEVNGYLYLNGSNITNVDGLSELITVRDYFLVFNTNIEHVDGLANLTTTDNFLYFATNPLLTNVDGLSGYTTNTSGGIFFDDNDQLSNLNGLSNLTSIGGVLAVRDNEVLSDVTGLSSVTSINGGMEIHNNPLLADCCALHELEELPTYVSYHLNAPGCTSQFEVEQVCSGCDLAIGQIDTASPSCDGNNDGSITVSASCTDCTSIQYSIGNGFQPENVFDGLIAGTYTLTVQDSGDPSGCQVVETGIEVEEGSGSCCDLAIEGTSSVMASCPNSADGSLTINASCTTCAGLEFSIGGDFQPENTFDNLPAGNFTVTVRDTSDPENCVVTETEVVVPVGEDNEGPVLMCGDPIVVSTNPNSCSAFVNINNPIITDNCLPPDNRLSSTNTVTIEAWVKPDGTQTAATAIAINRTSPSGVSGLNFGFVDNTRIGYHWRDQNNTWGWGGGPIYNPDVWNHVAVVIEPNQATIYVNGTSMAVNSVFHPEADLTTLWNIGDDTCCSSREYNGTIDEFRVWNYARTQAEIMSTMNTELIGNEAGLAIYFNLNQGVAGGNNAGETTANEQTRAHDGTLENFALTGTESNWVAGPSGLGNALQMDGSDDRVPFTPEAILTVINDYTNNTNASGVYPKGTTTVTFSTMDLNGNPGDCTQTVTVNDNEPPTVFCRNATVDLQMDGTATVTVDQVFSSINDNCNDATFSISGNTFSCDDFGSTQTVTLTATDEAGNFSSCQAQVTLNDNLGICCDLEISSVATVSPLCLGGSDGSITINANCTSCTGLEFSIGAGFQPGNTFTGLGAGTFTVTARDTGNPDCVETVTDVTLADGVDTEAPVFDPSCMVDDTFFTSDGVSCPADIDFSLDEGDEISVFDDFTVNGVSVSSLLGCVSDNCTDEANLTIIVDDITITGNGSCMQTLTVTFVAKDAALNISEELVQTFTFIDNTSPEVSFNGIPDGGTYMVECQLSADGFDPLIDIGELTITDNCSDIESVEEELTQLYDGPCVNNLLTRWQQVFTVTDACGNETVYTLFTEIIDTTPPVFETSPADVTIECDETADLPDMEAFDSCSDVVYAFNEVRTDGACPNNYTLTRTWLASDGCGNTSSEVQIVTVEDTTAPEIEFIDEFVNSYESGQDVFIACTEIDNILTVFAGNAVATDNCSGNPPLSYELADLGFFDCQEFGYVAAYISTWKSVDECGNVATATLNWFLVDETPPVLQNVPDDICVGGTLPPVANVSARDNCDFASVSFSQSEPIDCGDGGQYIERTWTATDPCGNTATATQRITLGGVSGTTININLPEIGEVNDGDLIQLPFRCDENLAANLEELEAAINVGGGCGSGPAELQLTLLDESDCSENDYLARYSLNIMASDPCGNNANLTLTIDFVDAKPPTVTAPEAITLNCGDEIPMITAQDDCGEIASITFVDSEAIQSSCSSNPMAYQRIWMVSDGCGNTTSFTQSITVIDNAGPILSGVPEDTCDDTSLDDEAVTAFDTCTGENVAVQLSEIMNSEDGCGEILKRTWTATDVCGNTSIATQQIFFADETAPEIVFNNDLLFGLESGDELYINVGDGFGDPNDPLFFTADDVLVTDNCASITAEVAIEITDSEDCSADGFLTQYDYVFTATDPCGNTSSVKLTVFYLDKYGPDIFNAPADVEVICDAIPEVAEVIVQDDFDEDVEAIFTETQTTTDEGLLITRTWTATDDCGNTNAVSQDILVVDNDLAAEFSLNADEIECNSDNNGLQVTASGGTPPYSYAWTLTNPLEDGFITSELNKRRIRFTMGYISQTFTVIITDANGCELTASTTVTCDFSDDEGDFFVAEPGIASVAMHVYPNPVDDRLMVKANGLEEAKVTVAIYNLFGQQLSLTEVEYWTTEGIEVDTRQFPNGTYLLRLSSDGHEVQSREVVVVH